VELGRQSEQLKDELARRRRENLAIEEHTRVQVHQVLRSEILPSLTLAGLLIEAQMHLSLKNQRTEEWENLDREVTRIAGGSCNIALTAQFNQLPESQREEIRVLLEEGREKYLDSCIEQVKRIHD
jgi:hypothetical protein